MKNNYFRAIGLAVCSVYLGGQLAFADSIDPASFSADLSVGESITVTKTVIIDDAPPTSGVLDVMFLFDTSGSMGGEIAAAKLAASDILSGLSAFGDLASGVAFYTEPGTASPMLQDLSTSDATTIASINAVTLGYGGGGGDFPEEGIQAIENVSLDTTWRTGSSRVLIALGDATFKESDGSTIASAQTALADSGTTFIGIDFGYMTRSDYGGIDPTIFADASGGSIVTSTDDPSSIVTAILAGVTSSFEDYTTVSVSDFGAGLPGVSVDVVAMGAGAVGDSFIGTYDRSTVETFEFDVTFTGLAEGTYDFDTYALVDGGSVAAEADSIRVIDSAVPAPSITLLLGGGLLGFLGLRRKSRK